MPSSVIRSNCGKYVCVSSPSLVTVYGIYQYALGVGELGTLTTIRRGSLCSKVNSHVIGYGLGSG